jgi:hypothetical protein
MDFETFSITDSDEPPLSDKKGHAAWLKNLNEAIELARKNSDVVLVIDASEKQ